MVQKFKNILLLSFLSTLGLHAGVLSVDVEGSAEADPDKYLYSLSVSARCMDSEQQVVDTVNDLEEKLSQKLTPYIRAGVEGETQYVSNSTNWARQYEDDVVAYDQQTGERKTICSAGKWYYTTTSVFELLDAGKLKELQKALSSLASANVSNPAFELNKVVSGIYVSQPTPALKKETSAKLFKDVYADASRKAKEKLNVVLGEDSKTFTRESNRIFSVEEKLDYNGRGVFLSSAGRSFDSGLEAAGGMVGGESAAPGIQKLKMTSMFTFKFEVPYDYFPRPETPN